MSDKPKAGGYVDNAALERAVLASEQLVELLQAIAGRWGRMPQPVAMLFQKVGFLLAEQRGALAEMEKIRTRRRGNE